MERNNSYNFNLMNAELGQMGVYYFMNANVG